MTGKEVIPGIVARLTEEYKEQGMETFSFEWQGTKTPKKVTFPDGLEKEVAYMKDGLLMFQDHSTVIYERLSDNPEKPQCILVGYKPTPHPKN